ncbi:hypothetical protein COU57_04975 [Candidatus Pacearchaeota archaeon CG10_big_fil_rev_8_21_14_0_10_32_14]|nr:MAG: hypothetical protein COU57_04975 [Candidatus Pacearchaeota archaeon CG10_big_fil_rev_8_21_14_0_10_32_14]
MGKINTPEWILEGYDSPTAWKKAKGIKSEKAAKPKNGAKENSKKDKSSSKKEKTYKIKICPKCKSDEVVVVLTGEEGKNSGDWECHKCKWEGRNIDEKELNEDEFMAYVDRKEKK